MEAAIILIGLVAYSLYQTWRDRTLRNRVKFLEEREAEVADKLAELIKEANDSIESRRAVASLLPTLRKSLAYFDEFQKTY